MKNQIEIVKEIADGMIGIGGIPTNEEFYEEFNSRVIAKLGIKTLYKQVLELKEKVKKLEFMIENGLGWEDMKNDISMPHEL